MEKLQEEMNGKQAVVSAKSSGLPLFRRCEEKLAAIKNAGLYRRITDLQYDDAVTARDRNGKKYIVFSSNNYLGLTFDPRVIKASAEAVREGTGSTGSRLTTGGVFAASELEQELAAFKQAEAALLFNTVRPDGTGGCDLQRRAEPRQHH